MRLKDKVAVVTGGGTGIGRAIVERFASEGAKIVIADIDPIQGQASTEMVAAAGGDALFVQTDVSEESQIIKMVHSALARYARIDVLCNNAAILMFREETRAHELSNTTWDRTMAVNLRGYWLTSKYVIPNMLENGGGSIIHVASPTGMFAFPRLTAYSTSKGGVIGLTRAMAADYAKDRIRVNAIIPGTIDTPMNAALLADPQAREHLRAKTLVGRLGVPEDLAGIALFLATDDSAFCAGSLFAIDGGQTAM